MDRVKLILLGYIVLGLVLLVYSYGFVDPGLLTAIPAWLRSAHEPLRVLVFETRPRAGMVYIVLVTLLYALYLALLRTPRLKSVSRYIRWGVVLVGICIVSYPAFSHDIFNYMLTAKISFLYRENPYIVAPTSIPSESMLAFTRAANKTALYGPVWILLTWIPHVLGSGNTWMSMLLFKVLVGVFYIVVSRYIYIVTRSWRNVVFFALHPLVLVETLVSGHNDIVMMGLVLAALSLRTASRVRDRVVGFVFFLSSVLIKGATIVLFPLLITRWKKTTVPVVAFWLMFGVVLLSPLREEMYPWYAIWFIVFAALVPMKRLHMVHLMSISVGFGLIMRHAPNIWTGEYGGISQTIRTSITVVSMIIPLVVYRFVWARKRT